MQEDELGWDLDLKELVEDIYDEARVVGVIELVEMEKKVDVGQFGDGLDSGLVCVGFDEFVEKIRPVLKPVRDRVLIQYRVALQGMILSLFYELLNLAEKQLVDIHRLYICSLTYKTVKSNNLIHNISCK